MVWGMTLDVGSLAKANALMELMQSKNLGYLAVSLDFTKLIQCSWNLNFK
jgi:methionine-gamma-lyase